MMKKNLILSLIFTILGLGSHFAMAQRPCAVPSTTFTPTVNHAICFDLDGASIDFVATGTDGAYLKNLTLRDASGTLIYSHGYYGALTGSISNLSPGVYTFAGSIVIEYPCNGLIYVTAVPINYTVWVGIQTVWTEKIDMITSPNLYSAKRNASTVTYGGVRSSNGVDSGDGWIEMKAQYGATTNNRVFWLIAAKSDLGTFDPNSGIQYIEFFKGSGGNGIRIKYLQSIGGSYAYFSLSTNENDKIRLVRSGSTLKVQKNNSLSTIFTLPVGFSGAMNIVVRSLALDDGCVDVVSTFECNAETDYAELRKKVDGGNILVMEGLLKFTYDEEYAIAVNYLPFNIYNTQRSIVASSDGLGSVTGISTPLVYQEDDARYVIDISAVSSMSVGEFYTLEVIDSKGNKKYLKFFYKN